MTPQEKYDKANCIRMSLKLNRTTDADILARLEEQDSKQGYIKRLIRADMAKLAKTMIESLPSVQPEPQWIPVSERLPETEEFVLASLTGKYRNTTFEHAREIADYADGEWLVYAYPHMSAEKCEELIEAWMPLPEPYKTESEDKE